MVRPRSPTLRERPATPAVSKTAVEGAAPSSRASKERLIMSGWRYVEITWQPGMFEPRRPNGCVLAHREAGARLVGRCLFPSEVVHHRDEDRANNHPDNLIVFATQADHARHHQGAEPIPVGDGTFRTEQVPTTDKRHACRSCGCPISRVGRCRGCWNENRPSRTGRRPTETELRPLVATLTLAEIAEMYDVSNSAVGKWCTRYGIPRPGRGYRKRLGATG